MSLFTLIIAIISVFLFFGILNIIIKRKKEKSKKTQAIIQNNEYKEKETAKKEQKKQEVEYLENQIKQNPVFNDGKIIYGTHQNAIAFSRTGEVGVFTDNNIDIKIINVKDIKSLKYQVLNSGWCKEYNCVIGIDDFDNPIIKINLAYDTSPGNSKELYEKIKQTYSALKNIGK